MGKKCPSCNSNNTKLHDPPSAKSGVYYCGNCGNYFRLGQRNFNDMIKSRGFN